MTEPSHSPARDARVLVRGHGPLLDGVEHCLRPGDVLVVGRSRSCDVSLRRTPGFRQHVDQAGLLRSRAFNRVSRVHCEIALLPDGRLEVRDLSRNGTCVDGERVRRSCLVDLDSRSVRVELCDDTFGRLVLTRPTSGSQADRATGTTGG